MLLYAAFFVHPVPIKQEVVVHNVETTHTETKQTQSTQQLNKKVVQVIHHKDGSRVTTVTTINSLSGTKEISQNADKTLEHTQETTSVQSSQGYSNRLTSLWINPTNDHHSDFMVVYSRRAWSLPFSINIGGGLLPSPSYVLGVSFDW